MSDQIYEPLVIEDMPLPTQSSGTDTAVTSTGNTNPIEITDNDLPSKIIAHETLSETINTKSKKITGDFSFIQEGALQIGDFKQGVNGDVRISQNGITARDLAGNTTFALDGDTGDAVFAGQLTTGAEVTGSVEIQSGGYLLLRDSNGLPSIFIGEL